MIKYISTAAIVSSLSLVACSEADQASVKVNPSHYHVKDAANLQQRFSQFNEQLVRDFQQLKKKESVAFAQQLPLDVNNLQTLNQHLVSRSALKPSKIAYCDVMNGYFAEMYRLGHYNLELISDVDLPHTEQENLKQNFSSPEQFYDFIINRYSTYRQVQQTMNYGCNLKAALN